MTTAFNYGRIRDNTAEPLIARFGRTATLTKPGSTTGDAWDPTPGTPAAYTITVVNKRINIRDRDGTYIQESDRLFMVSTDLAVTPAMGDTITVGSDTYQVVDITPLEPGSTALLWYVLCRK